MKPTDRGVMNKAKSTRLFLAFLALLMAVVFSIAIRGQLATHPDASSPPKIAPAPPLVDTYVIETAGLGWFMRAIARSDGICPITACNGSVRIAIPTRGIDDTYPARVSIRSTGQLDIDLEVRDEVVLDGTSN